MTATQRKFLTALMGAALLLPATAGAEGLPMVNLDDHMTDELATKDLQKAYPAGTPVVSLIDALGRSVPKLACGQQDPAYYICTGQSLFRGGFVYVKDWTVNIRATDGKLENISAKSTISSEKDGGEKTMQVQ